MQPFSGNQRPDLLTSLMNMSLVLRLPREMHLSRSSSNVPRLPSFLEMLQNPHVLLTFDKVHNPLRLPRKTTSERPKVSRTPQFFALLTSKCASRHNGVHFFKTVPLPSIAVVKVNGQKRTILHLQMYGQKLGLISPRDVPFSNHTCKCALTPPTACTLIHSSTECKKVLRTWCFLTF